MHFMRQRDPATTRSTAAEFARQDEIGYVTPGTGVDSRRPHEWLDTSKLHLRICGFYAFGLGQEALSADIDVACRTFEPCYKYSGLVEKSLGASVFIIVPNKSDREDPVKLWNAMAAYVEKKATARTST